MHNDSEKECKYRSRYSTFFSYTYSMQNKIVAANVKKKTKCTFLCSVADKLYLIKPLQTISFSA